MHALIITLDTSKNPLLPEYKISGPFTGPEAAAFTKEAYLVILLCDSTTAKRNKDEYALFLSCVSSSPLKCRKEWQIKTMEYLIGTTLSEMVSVSAFPEPVRITSVVPSYIANIEEVL